MKSKRGKKKSLKRAGETRKIRPGRAGDGAGGKSGSVQRGNRREGSRAAAETEKRARQAKAEEAEVGEKEAAAEEITVSSKPQRTAEPECGADLPGRGGSGSAGACQGGSGV